jgi:RNA polymerase sigma-70 factor (sigma-E family)
MGCAGNHGESRADDDAAFREYVLARGTALLRMAIMLTGNRADAEDLVQAALAKTYLAWGKINDRAALDAYVRRAMVNTHISWWRRRKLEEFPTDELPDQVVADHAHESDMAEVVRRALDRLPRRMRAAVMLRYFEDMTEQEIAAALGISLGTVKSTVSRAVARLRIDAELGEGSGGLLQRHIFRLILIYRHRARYQGLCRGLLPPASLMALSGMQVRHAQEVALCGAR